MRSYRIDGMALKLGLPPSSLRRRHGNGQIAPERATVGRTTLRIYDEETMRVLRRAKDLMDLGMRVSDAFGRARDEIAQREERDND
jgi:hypothetical protein